MIHRSFLRAIASLVGLSSVALVPFACSSGPRNSDVHDVGKACILADEVDFRFGGFKVNQDVIEVGAPGCGTGVCLANHFQGSVTCPLGQPAPKDANGNQGCVPERDNKGGYLPGQGSCKDGDTCVEAGSFSPECDVSDGQEAANKHCASLGAGTKCNAKGFCECLTDADCAFVTDAVVACDAKRHECLTYACHVPGSCQVPGALPHDNAGKACCVPGTDTPVIEPVCGQCAGQGGKATRDAEAAVYCTCRCGVAEGEPDDPSFDFCACPSGFECSEIRPDVGLGDRKVTGKYCIKEKTAYDPNESQCGLVDGYWTSGSDSGTRCAGVSSGQCQTKGGPCK